MQPDSVRVQLQTIISSPGFAGTQQNRSLLQYIVEETLAGRSDQINQYNLGVHALGRASDFNPTSDPIVRIQARRLRKSLTDYYNDYGVDDPIIIDIPKGRYVAVFLPNTAKSQNQELPSPTIVLDPVILNVATGPSIAILPFQFLGDETSYSYFASGLTEEIVITLTRFPGFQVIGPLSREEIARQELRFQDIGKTYDARFLLDGSIRRFRDILRISAKLTDSQSVQQIWGQTFEFDLETSSIIEIEDAIASQITATIADNFGTIPRTLTNESLEQGSDTLSDYEAILRFYHWLYVATEESLEDAVKALELTIQRDPENVMAAAVLGDAIASKIGTGYTDDDELLNQAETLGLQAVALDRNHQHARYTLGLVYYLKRQTRDCLEHFQRALQLNPSNATIIAAVAYSLTMMGDFQQGLQLMHKARRLNPHHPGWYYLMPFMDHYRLEAYDLALEEAKRMNLPAFSWDAIARTAVLGQLGRLDEAQRAIEELLALVPDFKERGYSIMRRMVYLDKHVDILLEGMHKAGLTVSS